MKAGVHLANENGEDDFCVAPLEEFQLKQWRKVEQVIVEAIPDGTPDPSDTAEFISSMIKSFAFFAPYEQKDNNENVYKIKVIVKPNRIIVVTENISKGKLVTAPVATTLKLTDPAQSAPQVKVGPKVQWLYAREVASSLPKDTTTGCKSFFWVVKPAHKEADANMALTATLSTHKIQTSTIDAWLRNHAEARSIIKVPFIKSTQGTRAGDELLVYAPKPESSKQKDEELAADGEAKSKDEPMKKKHRKN